jgi:hypothetical protein
LLSLRAFSQPNAVILKDQLGATISTHNSIGAAYTAIPATLTQAYVIELQTGYNGSSETYPITFSNKVGASSINTITVRPALGITAVSMITGSVSTSSSAVFILDNADYVTIDGRAGGVGSTPVFTIGNTATGSNTVQLINGSCFDTVQYVILQNAGTTSASRALHLSTSASNSSGNSDNYFNQLVIGGSRYGINSTGTASNPNTRNIFWGCEFQNVIFTGIWFQAGTGRTTIDSCRFTSATASTTTPYGILYDSQTDSTFINRNRFINLNSANTSSIRGIFIRSNTGSSFSSITNNFIALNVSTTSTAVLGIAYEGSVATNAYIAHNTILIGGTLASGGTSGSVVSAAFVKSQSAAASEFSLYNNIMVNTRTGGASGVQHPALSFTNTMGTMRHNYNTYNAADVVLLRYGSTLCTDISSWQTATGNNDINANTSTVDFVSTTDLHLTGTSLGNINLGALPLTPVTRDIDNELRSALFVYRGADELPSNPLPVHLLSFSGVQKNNQTILSWSTAYEYRNKGFYIERSLNGTDFTVQGFVAANSSNTNIKHYTFSDDWVYTLSTKRIYYRLRQEDVNGLKQYSATISFKVQQKNNTLVAEAFPNPFFTNTNISLRTLQSGTVTLQLYNLQGKLLASSQYATKEGTNSLPINHWLQKLAKGIYVLVIESGTNNTSLQLIKQ